MSDEFAPALCASFPALWDAPGTSGPLGARDRLRMEHAAAECLRECPRLASCLRDLAGMAEPDGVIAGRIYYHGERVA